MSKEELIIYRIFDDYCRSTGIALDGALLNFLIKQHLNQNKDEKTNNLDVANCDQL